MSEDMNAFFAVWADKFSGGNVDVNSLHGIEQLCDEEISCLPATLAAKSIFRKHMYAVRAGTVRARSAPRTPGPRRMPEPPGSPSPSPPPALLPLLLLLLLLLLVVSVVLLPLLA